MLFKPAGQDPDRQTAASLGPPLAAGLGQPQTRGRGQAARPARSLRGATPTKLCSAVFWMIIKKCVEISLVLCFYNWDFQSIYVMTSMKENIFRRNSDQSCQIQRLTLC